MNNNIIDDEFRIFFSIKKIRELLDYDQLINKRCCSNLSKVKLDNLKRILRHNYSQLSHYGINLKFDITNNKYELNDDFYLWFDFWNNHLNSMTVSDILLFKDAYNKKEPLDKFYPIDSWNKEKSIDNKRLNLFKK